MKRFYALMTILLLGSLACSLITPATLTPAPTIPSTTVVPPTTPPAEGTASPEPLVEETPDQPTIAVPEPVGSPQPAVAHHHPGDAIVLDRITMIDAQNGWAISGGDVLFTADSAQTWREVTPPDVLTPGSQIQAQGMFLDARHAWVVFSVDNQIPMDAVVWRTDDSGRTWIAGAPLEHQAFGEQVWAEGYALDAVHVWMMVRGVYVGAGTHYDAQLFRSASAGSIWQSLTGNETFDYNYDYTGLVFVDASHGLATWQTTGAYAPGPPNYAVTSNGADSWDVHELPPPPDKPDLFETFDYCEPFQPQMLSSQSIRLLMGCFDAYDPPHAFSSYLYSSEDGGSTWTSTRLPEKVLAGQDTLFFFGKDNALLLGKDIYRSADGGQSWEYVKSVTWDGQFTFIDPQTGWAIAHANDQTALVKTSNGGAAWIVIKPVIAP